MIYDSSDSPCGTAHTSLAQDTDYYRMTRQKERAPSRLCDRYDEGGGGCREAKKKKLPETQVLRNNIAESG